MLKHLLLLAACGAPLACGGEPEHPALTDFDVPTLRPVMFEVDELSRQIEPLQRDETRMDTVASMARSWQRWIGDPAWQEYMQDPAFFGDPVRYGEYLGWLAQGAAQVADSAERGDLEGVRAGFTLTQQSCIACHKRFQPQH